MKRLLAILILAAILRPGEAAVDSRLFDGEENRQRTTLTELVRVAGGEAPEIGDLTGIDDRYWITVQADGAAARTRLATAGLSIEEIAGGTVSGVANSELIGTISGMGLEIVGRVALSRFGPEDFPSKDGDYHNYSEAEAEIQAVAAVDPKRITAFPIGKSGQGRSITALRFFKDDGKTKPGIAFLGTQHAREHLSTEVPLLLARWLADNKDRRDVAQLLDTRDIYFIPMVNPDGVEYDISTGRYKWHRKNMRKNGDGSFGVDLNRNYDFRWGGQGSSRNPRSDTYHGPSAFSEPETQAVRDFLTARPNITTVISYHTFSELILYPWGGTNEPISDGRALAAFKAMAQKMAGMTGYKPMQSSGLYIATGDTCDWAWSSLKIFCFTFELTPRSVWSGGFYPGAGAIASTFKKNIEPALYLIDLSDNPYRAADGSQAALTPDNEVEPWSEGS